MTSLSTRRPRSTKRVMSMSTSTVVKSILSSGGGQREEDNYESASAVRDCIDSVVAYRRPPQCLYSARCANTSHRRHDAGRSFDGARTVAATVRVTPSRLVLPDTAVLFALLL